MAEISHTRIQECRRCAHEILHKLHVEAPDEIDLETIAWKVGRLEIQYGGITNCDGRIIASSTGGGRIRVRDSGSHGRQRFTIAHEIGHFVLHPSPRIDKDDGPSEFTMWHNEGEEAEANSFAAELLMPEFLVITMAKKVEPSLALADELAETFTTSVLASAIQYINYTNEQVALVMSKGRTIQWRKHAKNFWPRVRIGQLSPDSAAGERLDGKASDSNGMVVSPAYAWLSDYEYDREHDIMEDSRYLDYYDRTITLVWLKDDLEE
jgi:IrrE N-terminal-like domain